MGYVKKERAGKKYLKTFFFPYYTSRGRRRTVLFKTVPFRAFSLFFLEEKEMNLGNNTKMSDDSCPPLYNAYETKTLSSKFCKDKQN